jgi:NAD(P)H-dependent FMN reductase
MSAHAASFVAAQIRKRDGIVTDVVDLSEVPLAVDDAGEGIKTPGFSEAMIGADAVVIVAPEYNHSFPASLKQAIDYGYDEWQAKPVGFVSYGCRSVGLHAVEQLRTVFTALHATTVRDGVGIDLFHGELDTEQQRQDAAVLLDQLCWWGHALRDGRTARPYVS